MKAVQIEIKENIQGTNSEEKEIRTQINDLEQEEEINIQPEQNEDTRIQKNEELRNLWNKVPTSESWRFLFSIQKEKRKSKKLKTYLKK